MIPSGLGVGSRHLRRDEVSSSSRNSNRPMACQEAEIRYNEQAGIPSVHLGLQKTSKNETHPTHLE